MVTAQITGGMLNRIMSDSGVFIEPTEELMKALGYALAKQGAILSTKSGRLFNLPIKSMRFAERQCFSVTAVLEFPQDLRHHPVFLSDAILIERFAFEITSLSSSLDGQTITVEGDSKVLSNGFTPRDEHPAMYINAPSIPRTPSAQPRTKQPRRKSSR